MAELDDKQKKQIKNLKDIVRDELYGSGFIDDQQVLHIAIKRIKKIARKIAERVMIGPL